MSLVPDDLGVNLEISDLESFTPSPQGKYVLTCPEIHITYAGHHPTSLETLIANLTRSISEKGYAITDYSAVQAMDVSGLSGYQGAVTHAAVRFLVPTGSKFRIYGKDPFSVMGIPCIRLVKKLQQWNWIINIFHRALGQPIHRISCTALVPGQTGLGPIPLEGTLVSPPRARNDVRRVMRAKEAYEVFSKTNTDLILKVFTDTVSKDRGSNNWFSFFEDTSEIADYLMMQGQAVTFHNCRSQDIVATELQRVYNAGTAPKCVILCFTNGKPPGGAQGIYEVCDRISTGTLQVPKFRSGDSPLNTWRPHVIVFANFHPDIELGLGHWSLSIPTHMNHTGHMIVPRSHVETLVEAAKRYIMPSPGVVGIDDLMDSLRNVLNGLEVSTKDVPGAFKTITEVVGALLGLFTPQAMEQYWREGFNPIIVVFKQFGCPISGKELADLELAGETVRITQRTDLRSIIGKNGRIGNIIIRSVPLTEREKQIVAEKLNRLAALPSIGRIEDIVREGDYVVPSHVRLIDEAPLPPAMGPFDEKGGALIDFSGADEKVVYYTLAPFLRAYGAVRGFKTPCPLGEVWSNGWFIESKRVILEIDYDLPSKGEAYKMIYWVEQDYRVIRMRADDVGVVWRGGMESTVDLEQAIMDSFMGPLIYLDRVRERNSWKELQENIGMYGSMIAGHSAWWVKHVGPLPGMLLYESESEHEPDSGPTPAPPDMTQTPPTTWAVYCRTSIGSDDLIAQRNFCLSHAQANGLIPVAGPRNYFEDFCSPETPPGNRPGLQALLASGATGMLCAHVSLLADAPCQEAAVGFLKAQGVVFQAASP
jgi:hypothetical protein